MDSNGNVPGGAPTGTSNSRQESTNAYSTNPTVGSLFGNLVANLANLSTVQPQSYDGLATFMSVLTGQTFQVVSNPSTSREIHPSNSNMTNDQSNSNMTNDQILENTNAGNSNYTHTNMSRAGTDIEQAETITTVNIPTLPAMDLHHWEEGAEEQHPWNDENQNKPSSLKYCTNDEGAHKRASSWGR